MLKIDLYREVLWQDAKCHYIIQGKTKEEIKQERLRWELEEFPKITKVPSGYTIQRLNMKLQKD